LRGPGATDVLKEASERFTDQKINATQSPMVSGHERLITAGLLTVGGGRKLGGHKNFGQQSAVLALCTRDASATMAPTSRRRFPEPGAESDKQTGRGYPEQTPTGLCKRGTRHANSIARRGRSRAVEKKTEGPRKKGPGQLREPTVGKQGREAASVG